MNATVRRLIVGLLRHGLQWAIGWLTAKQILTEDDVTSLLSGIAASLIIGGTYFYDWARARWFPPRQQYSEPRNFHGRGAYMSIAIVASAGLLVTGCAGPRPIPRLPDQVPAAVGAADTQVRAGAVAALELLESLGDITNDLSRIRAELQASGIGNDAWHSAFSRALVAFSERGLAAIERIEDGVESWAELKAIVDPLLADANPLIDGINDAAASANARLRGAGHRLQDVLARVVSIFVLPGTARAGV